MDHDRLCKTAMMINCLSETITFGKGSAFMNRKILKGTVKGFTLLEMITALSIIIVLTSIMVPNIMDQRRMAKIQSENDHAYQVYVAAQDYLNYLQKYGKNATDEFVTVDVSGTKITYLVVDEGTIDYASSLGGMISGTASDTTPSKRGSINRAFVGICKRMGVNYKTNKAGDEINNIPQERYTDSSVRFYSPELNSSHLSFAVAINPQTYTVQAVFATDYMTAGSALSPSDEDTNGLMRTRLTARAINHSSSKNDKLKTTDSSKARSYTLYDQGFECMATPGGTPPTSGRKRDPKSAWASQEAATKYSKNYQSAMYMGQYPLPMSETPKK
jgi:type II secretory pathway pseudopilin PulG